MSLTLIVTGMHRSGTSLIASFVQTIGVNLGEKFFEADFLNVKGYFEDIDFLEFQRTVLQESCRQEEEGWHDWGWTTSEWLDYTNFQNYIEPAQYLIKIRESRFTTWGWKDPRTALMLDFWNELLPEAKYLFVYRFPWDVLSSIVRPNPLVFSDRPDFALKVWAFYNRHLLQFYRQHSERCILLNVNAFIRRPKQLIKLLESKLSLQVTDYEFEDKFREIYDWRIFNSLKWNDAIVKGLYQTVPQYFSLLAELEQAADLPSNFSLKEVDSDLLDSKKLTFESSSAKVLGTAVKFMQLISTESSETGSNKMAEEEIAVSVVIPCYNQGEYILEAISSVESCQDAVYEILIVNDASTEPLTIKILNYLKSNGYFVIDHESNKGLAQARNTGIAKARGRYILPLDCDNKIRPEYITKSIEILDKHPEVGVVYSDVQLFEEKTDICQVPDFDIHKLAMGNYIDACAVIRKEVWLDCGGYDDKIPDKLGYEDWDFWLSAATKGWKFYHIGEVLFDYRVREDSMVSICKKPENHARLVRYICTKHIDIYKTNFASILAEKDADLLREKLRCEEVEMKLQETQAAWEEAQEQVQRIQGAWEEALSQVQRIQSAWEEAQEQVKETQVVGEESQEELQRIQSAWEEAQEQLRETHAEWEKSQSQVQDIQTEWEKSQSQVQQIQTEWEKSQSHVQQIQTEWERTQERSQQQIEHFQTVEKQSQEQVQRQQEELQRQQEELQRIQSAWEEAQEQLRQTHGEWEKSQSQVQQIQTEWERSQSQLQQTHAAWEQAQQQVQQTHVAWEQAQQQLQQTHVAWERSQSQLQQTHVAWERSQQQVQSIQAAWEQSQSQLQQTHVAWERSQQQVQSIQAAWEQSQEQIRLISTEWERSQMQLQQNQAHIKQIQAEWERSQSQVQSQLQQMQAEWERSQSQLQQAQAQLQQSQAIISQMENSKFWKLRTAWFRFKQAIGFSKND